MTARVYRRPARKSAVRRTPELVAQMQSLSAEGLSQNAIARALGISQSLVQSVLADLAAQPAARLARDRRRARKECCR